MATVNEIRKETAAPVFEISRVFDAPVAQVFKAWTETERLAQWLGPKGIRVEVVTLDLRTDGIFHYCLQGTNGGSMWGRFRYLEIAAPHCIVYVNSFSDPEAGICRAPFSKTWALEVHNTLTLSEQAGKTRLNLHTVPFNATEEECSTFAGMHNSLQQGFTGTLDQLESYLSKL